MKKIRYILLCLVYCGVVSIFSSCSEEAQPSITLGEVMIQLSGLDEDLSDMNVQLRNITTNSVFIERTNQQGVATFRVTPGIYEAAVSASRNSEGITYIYNGTSGQVVVQKGQQATTTIQMRCATTSQVVIKELYCGGCMSDNGVDKFQYDKCVILYNNSSEPASLSNLCFGIAAPANAQANNNNYTADGHLTYEGEGFIPVWNGIWYFPETLTIAPYSQVVINIHGAINNTLTYSQSIDYGNSEYYCMFDPESGYNNSSYYPTPSERIPTNHYLKAVKVGVANAWPFSVSSPALVVFQTKDVTPAEYAQNVNNYWYDGGGSNPVKCCVKVPNEWIVDAIEVYSKDYQSSCVKRLTADVDAGYVFMTNYKGHSIYRNVDQEATEGLVENKDLLVYNYVLGVDDSTDPSGIDAEASRQRGAHIIYQDTNNATNDFHERQLCSLRK